MMMTSTHPHPVSIEKAARMQRAARVKCTTRLVSSLGRISRALGWLQIGQVRVASVMDCRLRFRVQIMQRMKRLWRQMDPWRLKQQVLHRILTKKRKKKVDSTAR